MPDTPDPGQRCSIEFRVTDMQRFQIFLRFFHALQQWMMRRSDTQPLASAAETQPSRDYDQSQEWLLAFRPQDMAALGMPPHSESIQILRSWDGLSRQERREQIGDDPRLQTLADFTDMLRQLRRADFEVVSCEIISADRARMEIAPQALPLRHRDGLDEMLLFFGFPSITDDTC